VWWHYQGGELRDYAKAKARLRDEAGLKENK
jgi:hypothetical protein